MGIDQIRVSIGTAAALGLVTTKKFSELPTTCYIMTYIQGKCIANCGFCPQARESKSSADKLSRITWPIFLFKDFLIKLKFLTPSNRFKRICIQTLNYPNNFRDLVNIVKEIIKISSIPISVAIPPMSEDKLNELRLIGVNRVGIALDGATRHTFDKIKGKGVNGPYSWEKHRENLKKAVSIFKEGNVSTHIIIGLGDTQEEIVRLLHNLHRVGITSALFAFTPIKGTKFQEMSQPALLNFRKIQLARHFINYEKKDLNDITFNSKGEIINFNINKEELWFIIDESEAFMTSGCPDCNRPYYTSHPSGPIYNYPRELYDEEKEIIYQDLKNFIKF